VADDKTEPVTAPGVPVGMSAAADTAPQPIASAAPSMPTSIGVAIPGAPPGMPTSIGVAIPGAPPDMPTSAAAAIPGGPPALPASLPPDMPTSAGAIIAGAVIGGGPPGLPFATGEVWFGGRPSLATTARGGPQTAPATMPTMASDAAPQSAPPSMPRARYELGAEIARGGMGRVVDATDTTLGRVVAFKEALSVDQDTLRRFQREVRITARLEHPSIVPVHDAGESSSGAPFYVMRKVSGMPLERLVAAAETLGQRLALIPHIVDSAQAIAHAHERGIVHRDIKPSNILVGDLGETVVIDWGLAKVIGEPDDQMAKPLVDLSDMLKTRAGIVYGTPGFMAPEQLRGHPVNEQCDVYALGATLYHLLSRKPPHHAKTADEMMKAAVAAPPTPVTELVEGVPRDLATIVDKALAHDPRVRYQNARALAHDLQRFLTGQLVAAHHYSRRDKLVRFIRKNRGLSAAVAALLVVGSLSVVRIVVERNRADRERAEAVRRAEELTLTQARYNVDLNPTKAVAMLKTLPAKYWQEVRSIAAAARATGVAWSAPASKTTRSLELSRDGKRALSAGGDGVVRIHDLVQRTTRAVAELQAPVMARFADGDRRIVAWRGTDLAIIDAQTGARRDLTTSTAVVDLEVVGTTAYWVDDKQVVWQLDLAGSEPVALAFDEPIRSVAPSPDERWIALAGERHLLLFDRTRPEAPPTGAGYGQAEHLAWSPKGDRLAALIDQQVLDVATRPAPTVLHRQSVGKRYFVGHDGRRLYVVGPTGVSVTFKSDEPGEPGPRKQLSGTAVGLVASRGGTMVAGATGGLAVLSDDGDHMLPLQAAHIERIVASPHSPYVIAQMEHRLLVWNLDDVQPRRIGDPPARALFATADLVVAGGTDDAPAQAIDLATGKAQPLGAWQGLRSVAASPDGHVVAIVDDAHHLHLIGPGRAPEDLPGEVDIAGFAGERQLVLAMQDGAIFLHDIDRRHRTALLRPSARLLGLAWGRGRHPWVAGALADGTLWRANVATGANATIARVPGLDGANLAPPDGKLNVGPDGEVLYLSGSDVHAWRTGGTLERLARAPKPLDDFGDAGPSHVVAFARDTTVYTIARATGALTQALAGIEGSSASMSPDTGRLVVLDHGAIEVLDPMVQQRWTLAPASATPFEHPAISSDGRRVLAQTKLGLLVWSLDVPATATDTARWLDVMTNAVDDKSPGGLGWR
jgi:hypothetical protein